ncbi:MAG: hypothetical protein J5770_05975 [Bacteroidaceae bacterium]|nr:hypothetical protein [Bacteroidaceae bacterium]
MKRIVYSILLMLPLVTAILTSCSGDNLEADIVSSDRLAAGTRMDVSGEASTNNVIPVEANCTWTVTTDVNWITITKPSAGRGNGSESVVFDVAASISPSIQTGTITIRTGSGIERVVTVNQRPGTIVILPSPATVFFTCEGGDQTLLVTGNSQWTATSSVDWMTIDNVKSVDKEGVQRLTIHVDPNNLNDAVVGSIILTDKDNKIAPVNVKVEVGGRTPMLIVTPANEVDAGGGVAVFGVKSNFNWEATVTALNPAGDAKWALFPNQLSQYSGTPSGDPVDVELTIEPNPLPQERFVTVTVVTQSSIGNNVQQDVTIIQRGASLPEVYLPHTTNVAMNEATLTFSATSVGLPIIGCGLLYSTEPDQVSQGSRVAGTIEGEEATVTMKNLQAGTTYYVRAYATSAAGTGYSEIMSFKTRLTPGRNDNQTP